MGTYIKRMTDISALTELLKPEKIEEYRILIEEVGEQKTEIKWLPINTAPKDGTKILLYIPEAEGVKVKMGYWLDYYEVRYGKKRDFSRWYYEMALFETQSDPTHWMPVPKVP